MLVLSAFGALKAIQEVITLLVFAGFTLLVFKTETFRTNRLIAFVFWGWPYILYLTSSLRLFCIILVHDFINDH